jgi:outer membrane protein OmpA-like peptidoglycan-associated protein
MKVPCVLLAISLLAFQGSAFALSKVEEHPVIKPIPRSQLVPAQSRAKNYASHQFRVKKGKKAEKVEKKGKYWHLRYVIKDGNGKIDKSVSREEIVQNYKEAALEKGGNILYEETYLMTFTLTRKDGGTTWAFLSAGNGSYNLDIIDEAAFKKQLTFDAEEMKRALDEEGRVAIYGINFDIDRAVLKLGAEEVLIEMVKLMKNNPDLKIEIQGHTDNTGSADHNLDLSTRRAETVKKFLLVYGIEAPRMDSKGYGEEKPVAPNDTEEGRAMNRRVELIDIN